MTSGKGSLRIEEMNDGFGQRKVGSMSAKREGLILLVVCLAAAGCQTGNSLKSQTTVVQPVEVGGELENGSFTANLNGFDIHYEVHGKGPVLMTVPNSWGLTLEGLRALYRPLEQHLTMVYFDPRGMGSSGPIREESDMGMTAVRTDFNALRKHLGLERVAAIGWSNGAMNLTLLASENPDTLSSAIFLHGTAHLSKEDKEVIAEGYPELVARFGEFHQIFEDTNRSDEEKTRRVKKFYKEVWFPFLFADRESASEKLTAMYKNAGFSWSHARHQETETADFDSRDKLPKIKTRSLVIAGRHDMLPVQTIEEIARLIPDSQFHVFENSGHFAPVEEPEAFVAKVLEFLEIQ